MAFEFRKVNFGFAEAATEAEQAPELIDDAYVNVEKHLERVVEPARFLVYGSKGSGKTALGMKLLRRQDQILRSYVRVDYEQLDRFPFSHVATLSQSRKDDVADAVEVWRASLMVRALPVVLGGKQAVPQLQRVADLVSQLERVLGERERSLGTMMSSWVREPSLFGRLLDLFTVGGEQGDPTTARFTTLYRQVMECASTAAAASESTLLILDGLDTLLRPDDDDRWHIYALLLAVESINAEMRRRRLAFKILLLMREEVLFALPDPNLAKRVADHGVALEWMSHVGDFAASPLWRVIWRRASVSGYRRAATQLVADWLPGTVRGQPAIDYIVSHTRRLPRDLIQVFSHLQRLGSDPPFSDGQVVQAVRAYADWFVIEMSSSLIGLIPDEASAKMSQILGSLGREFSFEDFRAEMASRRIGRRRTDAEEIAAQLYRTGFIGHVWSDRKGRPMVTMKHTAKRTEFDVMKRCFVHPGLVQALQL